MDGPTGTEKAERNNKPVRRKENRDYYYLSNSPFIYIYYFAAFGMSSTFGVAWPGLVEQQPHLAYWQPGEVDLAELKSLLLPPNE